MLRAPTSLKASVGPWNSSSAHVPATIGTSGTSKASADAISPPSWSRSNVSATSGAMSAVATSGSGRPRSAAHSPAVIAGIPAGTYSPPSGARARLSAAARSTGGAAPRVLTNISAPFLR